jgi:DNA-binding LacI/PurR family transcriptional regulator
MNNSRNSETSEEVSSQTNKLYRSIYLDLKQSIVRGDFSPANQIGTEKDLAQRYGVSVGTIRKTQSMLVEEGLLIKQQGRGTFVSPEAVRHRRLLWVCGVDVFDGDISPYYMHFLQACHRAGQAEGLVVEPAWLSHVRPDDSQPYLTKEALCRYAGYVFVGCVLSQHHMLGQVAQRQLPYAHMVHWQGSPQGVQLDHAQGVRLGVAALRQSGCEHIEVMGYDEHLFYLEPLFEELKVEPLGTPTGRHVTEVEHMGYRMMQRRLSQRSAATFDGMLFLDDILARGATRALLQNPGQWATRPQIAVMSDKDDVIPLGLPVIRVVHDNNVAARAAIDMVMARLQKRSDVRSMTVPFEILPQDPIVDTLSVSRPMRVSTHY